MVCIGLVVKFEGVFSVIQRCVMFFNEDDFVVDVDRVDERNKWCG